MRVIGEFIIQGDRICCASATLKPYMLLCKTMAGVTAEGIKNINVGIRNSHITRSFQEDLIYPVDEEDNKYLLFYSGKHPRQKVYSGLCSKANIICIGNQGRSVIAVVEEGSRIVFSYRNYVETATISGDKVLHYTHEK